MCKHLSVVPFYLAHDGIVSQKNGIASDAMKLGHLPPTILIDQKWHRNLWEWEWPTETTAGLRNALLPFDSAMV